MRLEFYKRGTDALIAATDADSCPDVGEKINIRKESWKVVSRSWALDRTDEVLRPPLRVNLNCEPTDSTL